jgi:hypothetical protein
MSWLRSCSWRLVGRASLQWVPPTDSNFPSFIMDLYKKLVYITYKILFSVLIFRPNIYKVKYL